jgi:hypothetical protein
MQALVGPVHLIIVTHVTRASMQALVGPVHLSPKMGMLPWFKTYEGLHNMMGVL